MSKYIFAMVAVLACLAGSARAEESISADTLRDMGISTITVMDDSEALAVRGMGFRGGNGSKCSNCGIRKIKSPWSAAFGASFATINVENGGSHSENGYEAEGAYAAGGENYSEAASEVTNIESVEVGGVTNTITTTCITKVYAGGSSSAFSF
jgi:hypothetical protein